LWCRGSGNWRINYSPREGEFFDICVTPGQGWKLTPTMLTIVGPRAGFPEQANLAAEEAMLGPELGLLLTGGLNLVTISELVPGPVRLSGDCWVVEAPWKEGSRPGQRLVVEYSGRWDAGAGRGFVERMRISENDLNPEAVGETTTFEDWTHAAALGRWVASKAVQVRGNGRPDRAVIYESSEAGEPGTFERVTRLPDADAPDPIRGKPTFTSIMDYRSGVMTSRTEAGEVTMPVPGGVPRGLGEARRRWLGWLTAAFLVAGFVALRLGRTWKHAIWQRKPKGHHGEQ
jgi:hypothetical protein